MLSKVRETFEILSCLHPFSAFILSRSLSSVFFLISFFLHCFYSLCQSCMPITAEPTCAEQVILLSGEPRRVRNREKREKKCDQRHRGAFWGRAKCTASATGVLLSHSAWHSAETTGELRKDTLQNSVLTSCYIIKMSYTQK